MRQKGQLQLEAAVCFAAFLAILGLFLGSINQAAGQADQALNALEAKSKTEMCCIAADSVYASSIEELSGEMPCTAKESIVQSNVAGKSKESGCLAPEIRLVQTGEKSVLEVKLSEHYR